MKLNEGEDKSLRKLRKFKTKMLPKNKTKKLKSLLPEYSEPLPSRGHMEDVEQDHKLLNLGHCYQGHVVLVCYQNDESHKSKFYLHGGM